MSKQTVLAGIRGKIPILHKLVYELRYREGYAYLDKCGRIINKLLRFSAQWVLQGDVSPQGASLVSMENAAIFNYSSANLSLSLEMPLGKDPLSEADVNSFIDNADDLTGVVTDQLGIGREQVTRIGFRIWLLFACTSKQDSEEWLRGISCFKISQDFVEAFGRTIDSVVMAIDIVGEDRHFRINFTGAERQAQLDLGQGILSIRPRDLPENQRHVLLEQLKTQRRVRQNPEFAAMVDIDCYQESPEILEPRHFLRSSWEEAYPRFRQAVSKVP